MNLRESQKAWSVKKNLLGHLREDRRINIKMSLKGLLLRS